MRQSDSHNHEQSLTITDELYSLENAERFKWSSVSGDLHPERRSHLEKYLTGQKILDAGCGGGAFVHFLSGKGFEVTGIDKYEQLLRVAQEKRFLGTYVQADITELPFGDKTFDCAYCFDVLEHVNDQAAIQELARVTKKRLILAVPKEDEVMARFSLTFLHYQDKTHLRNYTPASLEQLVATVRPTHVRIFPELAVPTKELFRELLEMDLEQVVQGRLGDIEAVRDMMKADLQRVPSIANDPLHPTNSLKNRVKAKIINLPFVRAAYEKAFSKTYNESVEQYYREGFYRRVAPFVHGSYCRLLQRIFEEGDYKFVYTSLIAVVDLE